MKKILILGCGWVGESFAQLMLEEGFEVWATTTKDEKVEYLASLGIHAVVVNFDQSNQLFEIPNTAFDFVLNSVPASSKLDVLQTKLRFENVSHFLHKIRFKKQIFLSSIGIYPNINGVYDESYEEVLQERLLLAETLMSQIGNSVIYRLGGLFGKERVFAKYFQNKECTTGDQIANFVHLDDVITLIYLGCISTLSTVCFNVVAPIHPTKKEVILASATRYNFQLPSGWTSKETFLKIVDGSRLIKMLNYTFKHPDPRNF